VGGRSTGVACACGNKPIVFQSTERNNCTNPSSFKALNATTAEVEAECFCTIYTSIAERSLYATTLVKTQPRLYISFVRVAAVQIFMDHRFQGPICFQLVSSEGSTSYGRYRPHLEPSQNGFTLVGMSVRIYYGVQHDLLLDRAKHAFF